MRLRERLYEDFTKKSRLSEYQRVLQCAKDNGYQMVGVLDFYHLCVSGAVEEGKYLVNRHDIDTSPKVARKMFEIEQCVYGKQGSATYYFRRSTIDRALIKDIEAYGYETGYHYEELADYEKSVKRKNKADILSDLPKIQQLFLRRFAEYKRITGTKSLSVASHGDFINVKYKLQNWEILRVGADPVRKEAGIVVEAYDEIISRPVEQRIADQNTLASFPKEVIAAIESSKRCIMILTHPRNWEVDLAENIKANYTRAYQAIKYKL